MPTLWTAWRTWKEGFLLVITWMALRAFYGYVSGGIGLEYDEGVYLWQARALFEGRDVVFQKGPMSLLLPGILSLWADSIFLMKSSSLLVDLALTLLLFRAILRLSGDPSVSFWATALAAASPSSSRLSFHVGPEPYFDLFLFVSVFCMGLWLVEHDGPPKRRLRWLGLFLLSFGFSLLTKIETALPIVVIFALSYSVKRIRMRDGKGLRWFPLLSLLFLGLSAIALYYFLWPQQEGLHLVRKWAEEPGFGVGFTYWYEMWFYWAGMPLSVLATGTMYKVFRGVSNPSDQPEMLQVVFAICVLVYYFYFYAYGAPDVRYVGTLVPLLAVLSAPLLVNVRKGLRIGLLLVVIAQTFWLALEWERKLGLDQVGRFIGRFPGQVVYTAVAPGNRQALDSVVRYYAGKRLQFTPLAQVPLEGAILISDSSLDLTPLEKRLKAEGKAFRAYRFLNTQTHFGIEVWLMGVPEVLTAKKVPPDEDMRHLIFPGHRGRNTTQTDLLIERFIWQHLKKLVRSLSAR